MVVLKLFVAQGTGRTDNQTDKAATIYFPFGEHKNQFSFKYSKI